MRRLALALGLIGFAGLLLDALNDLRVMVPTFMEKLHEPHTTLNKPTGQ